MIEVLDWSREVVLGARAWIIFRITDGHGGLPPRPIVELSVDVRVDGAAAHVMRGADLRATYGMWSVPLTRVGTYSLHVLAVDSDGCRDETGMYRPFVVVQR